MPSPQTHRTSLGEPALRSPDAVQVRERPHRRGVLDRDAGRADLPVVGPDDSPRRVARRLV